MSLAITKIDLSNIGKMGMGDPNVAARLSESRELAVVYVPVERNGNNDGWMLWGMHKGVEVPPPKKWTVVHVRAQMMLHKLAVWDNPTPAKVFMAEMDKLDMANIDEHGRFRDQLYIKPMVKAEMEVLMKELKDE